MLQPMSKLFQHLYTAMPGLRTEPEWMSWAVVALAGLLGVLAWMLLAALAEHVAQAWRESTPAGRVARLQTHRALQAQAQDMVNAMRRNSRQRPPPPGS